MEKRGESLQMRIKFIHTIIILRSSSRRFVTSLGFYGLMINVPNLQGDLYINFFISFLIEIPATPISWFLLQRYVLLLVNLLLVSHSDCPLKLEIFYDSHFNFAIISYHE